jgi:putative protein kinase ArgK-like GTPase of G3E family
MAIDPAAKETKVAFWETKTRMAELSRLKKRFFRPSPSTELWAALPAKRAKASSRELRFRLGFCETVGVGQSKLLFIRWSDFFLLLKLRCRRRIARYQRGIMEMAEGIVI